MRISKSPYGSPLFFFREEDKLIGVVDYRALSRITKKNNAPIPRTEEILDRIGGAKVFSRLHFKTGFHQVRMNPGDV